MKKKHLLLAGLFFVFLMLVPGAAANAAKAKPSISLQVLNASVNKNGVVSGQGFYLVEIDLQGTENFQSAWTSPDVEAPEEKDWQDQGLEWYEEFPGGKRGFVTIMPEEEKVLSDAIFVRVQTGKNKQGPVYSEPQKLVFRYKGNLTKKVAAVTLPDDLEEAVKGEPYTISWDKAGSGSVYYQLRVRTADRIYRWLTRKTSMTIPGEYLNKTGNFEVWVNTYQNGKLPAVDGEITTLKVIKKENKGLQLKRTIPAAKENNFINRNMVGVAVYKKISKLTKSMKISGKAYVPSKALQSAGDSVILEPAMLFSQATDHNHVLGNIMPTKTLLLKMVKGGTVQLKLRDPDTGKESSVGSFGSFKKTGSYYVVTFKNIPLAKKYYSTETEWEKPKSFSTSKKYAVGVMFNLHSTAKKKWSATVCVDDLTLKAGVTQTITFDKTDYKDVAAYAWDETPVSFAVKKVPVK